MRITMAKRITDSGLRKAIKAVGTRYQLAKLLGLKPASIQGWDRIPYERIVEVEKITGVPREELRPELYRTSKK
jgi:DNA-binding transcriptional regulator YdaS (Cro superfamily)